MPASITIRSKLTLSVNAGTLLYGTAIWRLNVEPVGFITPPELTVIEPPPLKVVPVTFMIPATTICPNPPPKPLPLNETMSPEAKVSIPLSASVSPDRIVTETPGPTASVASDPTAKPGSRA